jgi:LmbE family N-acetylglucosaminyl deacetylase
MSENKTVLAVGAHPDDVEFMCSGTLKLLKDRGYRVHIGVVANGDCGSSELDRDGISRVRRQEALEAASFLRAELHPLGEQDLVFDFEDRTRKKMTELVREVDPILVFTHPHQDYIWDHETTSRLVRAACFAASVPNYYTDAVTSFPRTSRIPWLYYWAPLEGFGITGDFVEQRVHVDVSSVIEFKAEMLS